LTIRWNGFSTAAGEAVEAGVMTVSTDANGGIAIPLIPNTGSSPSGNYYKVVVKLDDGTTSEELWVVPAAANITVAAIRAKMVPQTVAAQFVSRDYVDSALSAASGTFVHLSGAESIQGTKTFLASPEVPVPTDAGGATNKSYVDQEVAASTFNPGTPGAIGAATPSTVNATTYMVNGLPLASANLSDSSALIRSTGSYADPSWLSSLSWSKITGAPTVAVALATTPTLCGPNQYAVGISVTGNANCEQITASQVSALAPSATIDTTNASNVNSGTLPHAQLPALLSSDIPANAANTTGTAANLSGTPALPNGTMAATQTQADGSTKLATTLYVDTGLTGKASVGASNTFTAPQTFAAINTKSTPRFDVTAYGAVGNGSTDDTAAIQSAFDSCYNGGVAPTGGIVQFVGPHTYNVSSTLNFHAGCAVEGLVAGSTVSQRPPEIAWYGASGQDIAGFDSTCRYFCYVKNIDFRNGANNSTTVYRNAVNWNGRVDTGSGVIGAQAGSGTGIGFNFLAGGINVTLAGQWRCDGMQTACVYWKVGSSDSFSATDFTIDNRTTATFGGDGFQLDASASPANSSLQASFRNFKMETNTNLAPGHGVFYLLGNPAVNNQSFYLNIENTWNAPGSAPVVTQYTGIAMNPPSDSQATIVLNNSQLTTSGFLQMNGSLAGASAHRSNTVISPPIKSSAMGTGANAAPVEVFGDSNFQQIYQYGMFSSPLLESAATLSTLPNGTLLYSGQVIADPSGWQGNTYRKSLYNVYTSGETGTLNGGATTCSGTSGTNVLTCSSATGLVDGGLIQVDTETKKIVGINATNPSAVLVTTSSNLSTTHTNGPASYVAPALGNEMQLPTKKGSAPTSETWVRGDLLENSGASANGICGWVNVAAGTPGTWAAIPCGDINGKIANSQLSTPPLAATTGSIGGSALAVGCTNQATVTVSGATTAMVCIMSGVAGNPANVHPQCAVTAANTVTPQLCTAVATTPTAQSYNIRVIQ
jgi:hypothetical protein